MSSFILCDILCSEIYIVIFYLGYSTIILACSDHFPSYFKKEDRQKDGRKEKRKKRKKVRKKEEIIPLLMSFLQKFEYLFLLHK
jgi:preprotein translocase subunit Sec63